MHHSSIAHSVHTIKHQKPSGNGPNAWQASITIYHRLTPTDQIEHGTAPPTLTKVSREKSETILSIKKSTLCWFCSSSNKTDLHCDVTDATAATPNLLRSRHFFQTNTHTHMFSLKPGEKDLENPTRRGSYDWSCLPNYYFKGQEWALAQGLNMIRLLLPLCRMSQAYSDLWGADFAGWYKSNKSSLRALHRLSDEMLGDECSNYLNHLSWLYGSRAI